MTAVSHLTSQLLRCQPPSPVRKPPLIYVKGFTDLPDEVHDPRVSHLPYLTAPDDFYIREFGGVAAGEHGQLDVLDEDEILPPTALEQEEVPAGGTEDLPPPPQVDEGGQGELPEQEGGSRAVGTEEEEQEEPAHDVPGAVAVAKKQEVVQVPERT